MWRKFRGVFIALVTLLLPLVARSADEPVSAPEQKPEEIVITGERSTMQLRIQLDEAERSAYEIFNKLNDERRFDISCSISAPTGSRIERQVCQPEFEIQAMRGHAQDFYNSMGGPGSLPEGSVAKHFQPVEVEIYRQQQAFKDRMKQVAEEHPEFLDAIARYAALQKEFKERTGQAK